MTEINNRSGKLHSLINWDKTLQVGMKVNAFWCEVPEDLAFPNRGLADRGIVVDLNSRFVTVKTDGHGLQIIPRTMTENIKEWAWNNHVEPEMGIR